MSFLLLSTGTPTVEEGLVVAVSQVSGEDHNYDQLELDLSITVISEGGYEFEFLEVGEFAATCSFDYEETALFYYEEATNWILATITGLTEQEFIFQFDVNAAASGEDYFYHEGQADLASEVLGEDYFYEERNVSATGVVEFDEYGEFRLSVSLVEVSVTEIGNWREWVDQTIVGVVACDDYLVEPDETRTIVVTSSAFREDVQLMYEERSLTTIGILLPETFQNYLAEELFAIRTIVRGPLLENKAPVIKGRNPRPGETAVIINKMVGFYVVPGELGGDGVDISTVRVRINGVEYGSADPEFSYVGTPSQYYVEVGHQDWSHEQSVTVEIDAASLCGTEMQTITYSFTTEWESNQTRRGRGRIELFPAADYSFDVLTIQEDWVRQGVERYTAELELWWGRYQKMPYIENLEMRLAAGATNARGKEVLEQGMLSVKVDGGSYVAMTPTTTIDLGPMFTHTKRGLCLKLLVPGGAATKKYFVVDLEFEPQLFFPYGRFHYGRGIYAQAGNMIDLYPKQHVYRAYVFDTEMWNSLTRAGIITSGSYRGEDKKW